MLHGCRSWRSYGLFLYPVFDKHKCATQFAVSNSDHAVLFTLESPSLVGALFFCLVTYLSDLHAVFFRNVKRDASLFKRSRGRVQNKFRKLQSEAIQKKASVEILKTMDEVRKGGALCRCLCAENSSQPMSSRRFVDFSRLECHVFTDLRHWYFGNAVSQYESLDGSWFDYFYPLQTRC